jgi:hypothetical protein
VTAARVAVIAAAGLCLGGRAQAESPLSRLAARLTAAIEQVAGERSVELRPIQDRTGRGATFALDLHGLVLERLGPLGRRSPGGPGVRVDSVLIETPHRLIVSARVVAEPEGRLLDLVSVSVPTDPALLALSPVPSLSAPGSIDIVGKARTPPLEGPVLDVVLLPEDRVLLLAADAVALYRFDGANLAQEARRPLPGPLDTVRAPGGLLVPEGGGAWALTSRSPRATFFAVEGGRRLVERQQSPTIRFPGSAEGVRFRPGTNLLEGAVAGLGAGPFLALEPALPVLALGERGQLLLAADDSPRDAGARAGPALAALWPPVFAAASAAPPGGTDAVQLFERTQARVQPLDAIPLSGHVRALGADTRGAGARLVAAVEDEAGTHLLVLDLRRREP